MKAFTALLRPVLGLGLLTALLVSCAPSTQARQPGIVLRPTTPSVQPTTQTNPIPKPSEVWVAAKTNPSPATSHPTQTYSPHPPQMQTRYAISERYTASKGEGRAQGGQFDYLDESGKQLTDGILGGNEVLADLGRGRAKEWMAWGLAQPRLEFFFTNRIQIQRVQIRFNRNDRSFIGLPAKVVINGKAFTVNPQKLPNRTSGYLSFEGPFSGRSIKVEVTRGRGWVFVDEARFVLK